MPKLNDVKETALYVDNLERAKKFYREVLGLEAIVEQENLCAFNVESKHVLLLFLRGAFLNDTELPGGTIPPHDGSGHLHTGFSIDLQELPAWEQHFAAKGVEIEGRVTWPKGGKSIYFRDPDGHLLELLTPGVWSTY